MIAFTTTTPSSSAPKFDRTNVKFIVSRQHPFLPQHQLPTFRRLISREQGSETHLFDATCRCSPTRLYSSIKGAPPSRDPFTRPSFMAPFAFYDWDEVMFSLTPHISSSWEARLNRFMGYYAPESLFIPGWSVKILTTYAGKEEQLFGALVMKYGPERPVERISTQILGLEEESIERGLVQLDQLSKTYSSTINCGGGKGPSSWWVDDEGAEFSDEEEDQQEEDSSDSLVIPIEEKRLITHSLRRSMIASRMERLKRENHLRTVTILDEGSGDCHFCLDKAIFNLFWPQLLDELVDPASVYAQPSGTITSSNMSDGAPKTTPEPAQYLGLIGDKIFAMLHENPELIALLNNQICTYRCPAITCSPMLFSKLRENCDSPIQLSSTLRRSVGLDVNDVERSVDVLSLLLVGSLVSCIYIQPQDYLLHETITKLKATSTAKGSADAIVVQYEEEISASSSTTTAGGSGDPSAATTSSSAILATLALPEHVSAIPVDLPQRSEVLRLEQEFTHRILKSIKSGGDDGIVPLPLPEQIALVLINQSICPVLQDPLASQDGAWSLHNTPQTSQNSRVSATALRKRGDDHSSGSDSDESSSGYGQTKQQFRQSQDVEELDEILLEILREDGFDVPALAPVQQVPVQHREESVDNRLPSVDFCSALGVSAELKTHVQKSGVSALMRAAELGGKSLPHSSICSRGTTNNDDPLLQSQVNSSVCFRLEAFGVYEGSTEEEDSSSSQQVVLSDWHSVDMKKASRVSHLVSGLLGATMMRREEEKEALFVPIALQRICSTESLEGLCWYIEAIGGGGGSTPELQTTIDDLLLLNLMAELDSESDLVVRVSFTQRKFLWKWVLEPAMVQNGGRDLSLELLLEEAAGSTSSSSLSSSYNQLFPWDLHLEFDDAVKTGMVGRMTEYLELATYLDIPSLKRLIRFSLANLTVDL